MAARCRMGMLPQAIQRPDTTHLSWVSCVPLALFPLYVADLVQRRLAGRGPRLLPSAVAALTAVVILFGVMPHFTVRPWTEYTREVVKKDYSGTLVQHDGRAFYVQSKPIAPAVQGVREVGAESRATGCWSAPPTCARRPTATRTTTTCSPSSRRPPATSRWTRAWPTPRIPAWPRRSPAPTG